MTTSFAPMIRTTAVLACTCVLGMLSIFAVTGVGQDPLQAVHTSADYSTLLLRSPDALRATIGLDDLFIAFYVTLFFGLGLTLLDQGSPRGLVLASVGLVAFAGFLDFAENFHFLVMLRQAELGELPSPVEISAQVWESLMKFHLSYVGLFLLSFALPHRTKAERALVLLSRFFQLAVGVTIAVAPRFIAVPLVFVRFSYFLTALILVAVCFGKREPAVGSSAPA